MRMLTVMPFSGILSAMSKNDIGSAGADHCPAESSQGDETLEDLISVVLDGVEDDPLCRHRFRGRAEWLYWGDD